MRYFILSFIFIFSGCASTMESGYISRADHPYDKNFYAGFEKVISSTMYVLKKQGWTIESESEPSIYERDDRYDNNGYRNLLIITTARKHFLDFGSMRLNVFIHSLGNTSDMEIRYESQTPFTSVRNDRGVQDILDAIDQEVNQ